MSLVLDASAACELLLGGPGATGTASAIERQGYVINAPHLVDLEVLAVLRGKLALGELSEPRAARALERLEQLPIRRFPHGPLARRIWELRPNLTPYDATYVALAEKLDVGELVTADGRLARALRPNPALRVTLVTSRRA